ncbi:MAG: flagellar hook-basal body complex protein [Fibromonadales bacterium]|nr:flagellar hook-basal body complex protein [Fibromonadales bacterium]
MSGLLNHQVRMDSVGNNIANVNTTGFKARRTTFSESFSQLIKGASRSESKAGGTNPKQIGLGVAVGSIDTIMGQGNLQNTGRLLDIGIEGNAFFGVSDGVGTFYTRCGAFQLDAQGYIVLPTNGMVLQGRMADSMGNFPPGTAIGNLQMPLNQQSPARATTEVSIARNLNANGEAKGSVTYTQRILHAADSNRIFGENGLNDKGRGKHDTVLSSLFDSNGKPFNMKGGDTLTLSFYTDTNYENKIENAFLITGDGAEVDRIMFDTTTNPHTPIANSSNTENGTAYFGSGNMRINSLDDLMRAIEYTLNQYINAIDPPANYTAPIPTPEPVSITLEDGKLKINGVRQDIFGFSIQSDNPNSGKIDDSASVTKAFNFGSYLGPGVLGSQTYTANGYTGDVNIPTGQFFPNNSKYVSNDSVYPLPAAVPLDIWQPKNVPHRGSFAVSTLPAATPPLTGRVQNNSGESIAVLIPETTAPNTLIDISGVVNSSGGDIAVRLVDGVTYRTIKSGSVFPERCTIIDPADPNFPNTNPTAIGIQIPGTVANGSINAIPLTSALAASTDYDLSDCFNNSGKSVSVFAAEQVQPPTGTPPAIEYHDIPAGSKDRTTTAGVSRIVVEVTSDTKSGKLLRPAEQYDYLADLLTSGGDEMGLIDGATISFTASLGDERINSTPLTYRRASTLLDDLMMQLRNDLKLPFDYMGKDNNNYPSVAIKTPSLGEDGIPEGALVFRGLPGKAFDIKDLTITGKNPGGTSVAAKGFQSVMQTTKYKEAENAEVVPTEIAIFDDSGAEHILRFEFTHTGVNGEWIWKASFSGKEIIDPSGSGSGRIIFGQDGTLAAFLFDDGGSFLQFDPANGAQAMRVRLNAGGPGDWKGLTSSDLPSSAQAQTQDGYPPGLLLEMSIDEFGLIEGKFSNGINKKLAQIMVVDFANPGGLMDQSDNVYSISANSGDAIWGRPKTQSSSSLRPGALEMANVDLANEFTNMITTQRGYQANSRIITVSDTMLEEAVNLKR